MRNFRCADGTNSASRVYRVAAPKKGFLLIMCVACMYSCRQHTPDSTHPTIRKFNTAQWLEGVDRYGALGRVRQLHDHDGRLYISSAENHHVVVVDSSFGLIQTIGAPGPGPGEFQGVGHLVVGDQMLFVHNEGKQAISVFDKSGLFEHQFHAGMLMTPFAFHHGQFFVSDPQKEQPIKVLDMEGETLRVRPFHKSGVPEVIAIDEVLFFCETIITRSKDIT